jgi:lysophospholipase L1-like esterase
MKGIMHRWGNSVLIVSLSVLLGFNTYYFFIRRGVGLSFYLKKVIEKPIDPILDQPLYQDYKIEYEYLNSTYHGSKYIVFLGDSITARFKVNEYFPHKAFLLNRGIFSDTTHGLLNRIESNCNNLDVAKCFILIGYNDLKYRTDGKILENYEKILTILKADEIYVMSLLPVSSKYEAFMQRIPQLNQRIKEKASKYGCTYVDISTKFIDSDGYMRKEFSTDGVHPNKDGYRELRKVLERWIE